MDLSLIIGVSTGFGMLIIGYLFEHGLLSALIGISPIFIVFGGTIGALIVQFGLGEVLSIPGKVTYIILGNPIGDLELITMIVGLAEKARRDGILSLETDINENLKNSKFDPILQKGMRLAVDGTEPHIIRDILENEIFIFEHKKKDDAAIFEAAGGYGPTMGIIGTVMGLIQVLGNMANPDELGPAVSVAFVATLYGVSFANLVYLPIAGRIKNKIKKDVLQKELIKEGIMSIQSGENPHLVGEKLRIFLGAKAAAEAAAKMEKKA